VPQAEAEVEIAAPIELVWRIMLDLEGYAAWNPFIVRIDAPRPGPARVGDDLGLHVRWRSGLRVRTRERITRLEPPRPVGSRREALLEYEFRGPVAALRLVRGRRLQALEQLAGGPTRYRTSERLHGALAIFVPARAVRDGFERHAAALAARAEWLARSATRAARRQG
jgi:hypothetical protein